MAKQASIEESAAAAAPPPAYTEVVTTSTAGMLRLLFSFDFQNVRN